MFGSDNEWRLRRLEAKLDLVLKHLGIQFKDPGVDEVRRLLQSDKTIEAIKAYRGATGASLRDAKDAVDALQAELGRR